MKIAINAIGDKMPSWVNDGILSYKKRFNSFSGYSLEINQLNTKKRSSNNLERCIEEESKNLIKSIPSYPVTKIALDVKGKEYSSEGLAKKIDALSKDGLPIVFLLGGPDGFNDSVREKVDERFSLSKLTLPHPIARLLLVESLYRAISIVKNLPYHRS